MIYWKFKKWICIDIENPFKTMNELKGVFIPLNRRIIFGGKNIYYPFIYCPKPEPILIRCCDVGWKDKYSTPRYEEPPYIWIHLFGLNLIIYWKLVDSKSETDKYWEQALWYLYYASYNIKKKGYDELDINKAKEKWPWKTMSNKSTWNDKFIIKHE